MDVLDELLSLQKEDRIKAVWQDVVSRRDKYRSIEPHDLAKALGVDSETIDGHWTFTRYALLESVEEFASTDGMEAAMTFLEGRVDKGRWADLIEFAQAQDEEGREPDVSFLTNEERETIEMAIMEKCFNDWRTPAWQTMS